MDTTNRGVAPADPTTAVGQVRYLLGDLGYSGLDPAEPGFGDYANFSDLEIEGFVLAGGGSVVRASGFAYLRLAALAAAGAISWKSDDLSVDAKIPASEFRLLARIAFEQADAEDAGGASSFSLTDFGDTTFDSPQELAPWTNPWATAPSVY